MKYLLLLLIAMLVISCGGNGSSSSVSPYLTLAEPAPMIHQNDSCDSQRTQAMSDNDYTTIFMQYYSSVYNVRVPLKHIMSGKKIISPNKDAVYQTYFKEEIVTYKDIEYGRWAESSGSYYISRGEDLEACANSSYERYTYEGAAFSITAAVNKSRNEIIKHGYNLASVELNIIPSEIIKGTVIGGSKSGSEFKYHVTDNASYWPTKNKIQVYPQSIDKYNESKIPFWEMPFITSHEYGHHVFYELTNYIRYYASSNEESTMLQHSCFLDNDHSLKLNSYMKQFAGSSRSSSDKFSFALGAMNEGFADLIANYTLDVSQTDVSVAECFKENRQISSGYFQNEEAKDFTYNHLEKMDRDETIEPPEDCSSPNFQEVHDVGAIFAYVVNNMLDNLSLTKDQKLQVILKVAKQMADLELRKGSPSEVFFDTVNLMREEAVKLSTSEFSCSSMKRIYFSSAYSTLSSKCE